MKTSIKERNSKLYKIHQINKKMNNHKFLKYCKTLLEINKQPKIKRVNWKNQKASQHNRAALKV